MYIKMSKTAKGAELGTDVKTYEKDEYYELSDDLGNAFLDAELAQRAKKPAPTKKEEKKEKDEKKDPKKDTKKSK